LFTLVAMLSLTRATRAEPGAVLVSGTASARQQGITSSAVAEAVRAAGWILGDKPYSAADAAAAGACLRKPAPWSCLSAILRDKRIQRVAVVSVDPKPGKAGTTDTVISERLVISNVDSLFVAQRFCDQCTDDRLSALAAELTKELIDRVAVGSGRTVLAIKSTPRGARAYVDANLVGVTDASISVVPGAHTITVELEEYRTETRHVRVQENTTEEVSVTLQPSQAGGSQGRAIDPAGASGPEHPIEPARPRRSRLVPGAITGVGLAALASGIVLFALDEDPVTSPGEEASRRYRDTATRGVVLGVSGLAVAGVGGLLWWKYGKASSAPVVAPVHGGAVIGLARSF
jgi:hypothetical protein